MPQQAQTKPWEKYQGPWTKYQAQPAAATTNPPTDGTARPTESVPILSSYQQAVPKILRGGILGAFKGAGIPETETPVSDLLGGMVQMGKEYYTKGDVLKDIATMGGYSASKAGIGLLRGVAEPGKQIVEGVKAGDSEQIAEGLANIGAQALLGRIVGRKPSPVTLQLSQAPREALTGMARRLYRSALKPSTTLKPAKIDKILEAGLGEGIPVSEKGLERLGTLVNDLNAKIAQEISSRPGSVNKFSVASRLKGPANKFAEQVNPLDDLDAIAASGNEFLGTQPGQIPATQAQALKVGTYRSLGSKSYGEVKGASIEAQKALARGLREEISKLFPEVEGLNLREGGLLSLEPELIKAVNRISNQQLVGIGTPIAGGAAGVVTGSGKVGAGVAFFKGILDQPGMKSRIAITISRGAKGKISLPTAEARIAALSLVLGRVASPEEGDASVQRTTPHTSQ